MTPEEQSALEMAAMLSAELGQIDQLSDPNKRPGFGNTASKRIDPRRFIGAPNQPQQAPQPQQRPYIQPELSAPPPAIVGQVIPIQSAAHENYMTVLKSIDSNLKDIAETLKDFKNLTFTRNT